MTDNAVDIAKPSNIILEAVIGSVAYGLDTASSDEDVMGIFVAPTSEMLSLYKVKDSYVHQGIDENDWCYHEVGKFVTLALKNNPTILELLYLSGYRQLTKQARMLVDNRHLFLSNRIRKSYGGYALTQTRKLNERGGTFGNGRNNRYEKHARHCFRLLLQGRQLLETGTFEVKVTPEIREQLFAIGKLEPSALVDRFAKEFAEFDNIESVLPDEPNKAEVDKLLLKIRKSTW